MLSPTSVVLASTITGIFTLIRLRMKLSFLWRVYTRTGDRKDLETAGKVISPRWAAMTEVWRREPPLGHAVHTFDACRRQNPQLQKTNQALDLQPDQTSRSQNMERA